MTLQRPCHALHQVVIAWKFETQGVLVPMCRQRGFGTACRILLFEMFSTGDATGLLPILPKALLLRMVEVAGS